MSPLEELRAIRAPLDLHLHELPGPSLKIILYLWRRTCGWGKQEDMISVKQFSGGLVTKAGKRLDCGTGLNKRTILRAIDDLKERGLIAVEKFHGRPSRYRLKVVTSVSPPLEQVVPTLSPPGDTHGTTSAKSGATRVTHTGLTKEQVNTELSAWGRKVAAGT